jgi:uncharacterized protein
MISKVRCPNCGQTLAWNPENPFRPFCSERCKNIDLGAWSTGDYVIRSQATKDPEDGANDADPADS